MAFYICDYSKVEYAKKGYESLLELEVQRIIATACGIGSGNFKKRVPLHELINYKCENENMKFKKYIGAVDFIKVYVNCLFPFIEIEGLDLSWTAAEIHAQILRMLEAQPIITLEQVPRIVKKGKSKNEA